MSIITNADLDLRISPAERERLEGTLRQLGVTQDWESEGRRAAQREEYRAGTFTLETQREAPLVIDGVQYEDSAPAFVLEEPEYDESVTSLPFLRMMECDWWPFKPRGARAGWRPVLGPKAWEAILDVGQYCLRCLGRHAEPHPDECARCKLTAAHRARAIDHLESVAEVRHNLEAANRPNRAERRARGERSKGGVWLPGMGAAA